MARDMCGLIAKVWEGFPKLKWAEFWAVPSFGAFWAGNITSVSPEGILESSIFWWPEVTYPQCFGV